MKKELGKKIKEIRTAQGLTLKDLSEKTNLSVSFLSMIERGVTTINITALNNIAEVLGENLTSFLSAPQKNDKCVIRSFEHEVLQMKDSKYIYSNLASDLGDNVFDPMIAILLPGQDREEVTPYSHKGQEFGYVLEGILTFFVGDKEYELYPGDSIHISSSKPHNWANFTNKLVKVLFVVTPSIFKKEE